MKEALHEAKEEIKRADHLIYVSLKYTKTVDMFQHILKRMDDSVGFAIEALLRNMQRKKKIAEVPANPGSKAELAKRLFASDPKIIEMVEFYLFLRRVMRSEYTKSKEYRRHITMTATLPEGIVEVNIDKIHEYFIKTKDYVSYVETLLVGKNE